MLKKKKKKKNSCAFAFISFVLAEHAINANETNNNDKFFNISDDYNRQS